MMTGNPGVVKTAPADRPFSLRLARMTSNVFSPPLVDAVLLVAVALHSAGTIGAAIAWGLLSLVFVCAIPMLVIARGVRRQQLTDHHIGNRQQRPIPLAITLLSIVVALVLLVVGHGPRDLLALVAAMATVLLLSILVTLSWKISLHSSTAAGALVVLVLVFGPWSLLLTPLVALVSWARVALGSHTMPQVIAGVVLAFIIATPVFILIR